MAFESMDDSLIEKLWLYLVVSWEKQNFYVAEKCSVLQMSSNIL
jgi:hypothetical protein